MTEWAGLDSAMAKAVLDQNARLLDVYRADPGRLEQDANIERSISEGAYAQRQLFELLQNATDAARGGTGRCSVVLTESTLYVANTGEPLSMDGALALMATHKSVKRGEQIGRFGLGFKSVLAVSDSPSILSRSGSLGFDRAWSREQLERVVPGFAHYPATRLAKPIDAEQRREKDPVLADLMTWATTVVCVPIQSRRAVLANSIRIFPGEFLLFSPHVGTLELKDRAAESSKLITIESRDGLLELNDAGQRSTWVVESQRHNPSRSALADGGYQAARESVDMTWAAPVEGARVGVGAFWAYFPTSSFTTLSGIVNAPWKLADDRESLLAGPFNDEMLTEVLPSLISQALPRIHRRERPAAVIDVLPARGKEPRSPADGVINRPVYEAVSKAACIPSLADTLRHPTKVRLHPDGLDPDELELWRSVCRDPEWWVHHSIASNERRSKVLRLMGLYQRTEVTVKEWLEHLVRDGSVEGSAVAVRLVARLSSRRPEWRQTLATARVLLLDDGSVHACRPGEVFLRGGSNEGNRLFIDPRVAGFGEVQRALAQLGIRVLDEAGALRSELSARPIRWENVWLSARRMPAAEADVIFREVMGPSLLRDLRARVRSSHWKGPGFAFLPGKVVPSDGSRDSGVVIDDRYHQQDLGLLRRLGFVSEPRRMAAPPTEPWRLATEAKLRDAYRKERNRPKLADDAMIIEAPHFVWPLEPLKELSPEGGVALTEIVVNHLDPADKWAITLRDGTSRLTANEPTYRYLQVHGRLNTVIGIQPVRRCLAWDDDQAVIDDVAQPLPFVTSLIGPDSAAALGLKTDPERLTAPDWTELVNQAGSFTAEQRALLYAWAAYYKQPAPELVRAQRGLGFVKLPPQEVAVTASTAIFESLVGADCPALLAASSEDAELLREQWGMAAGEGMLEETLEPEFSGEAFRALDRFPPLRNSLPSEWQELMVQPCSRLELLTSTPAGQRARPLRERLVDMVVLTTSASDRELLLSIGRAVDVAVKPESVLRRMEEQRLSKNRAAIASTTDLAEKLVLAIGAEALRSSVPEAALAAVAQGTDRLMTDVEVARLAMAVDGYAVLQRHVTDLTRNGLEPPVQWAGRRAAREWVRYLGFPAEYAGFPGDQRSAEIEVEGPPLLGELHDYQAAIASRVRALLDPETEVRRGLVPLPTGAGKTRVAVQALVEHMSKHEGDMRIVWVAETDELCEQAVQTWSQVWRAKGHPGMPLTLSRLWASNNPNERDGKQVVVASVGQLNALQRRGEQKWQEDYGWLTNPTMIVVDEAHRSISPQYTEALSRLGGAKRVADMTTPLLGLTATPFRGWNEAETEVLAARYHRNPLDAGVFPNDDVYGYLQEMGVLARVRQIVLPGTTETLTEAELDTVADIPRVPSSLEQRLGQNETRNNTIVQSVLGLEPATSVLLFATSVENARVLAAILTYRGVEARAVSGDTDPAARRRYIEDFRSGQVRVLTNYNVFTEGFDVPSVDAVYITRPTFSPNVYQQMIGRGLRGRLNGGKDEVLVVNVDDNLSNYGTDFAFRHFDHLWKPGA